VRRRRWARWPTCTATILEGLALTVLAAIALASGLAAEAGATAAAALAIHRETGHQQGKLRTQHTLDLARTAQRVPPS
jgi:hypothetical protein